MQVHKIVSTTSEGKCFPDSSHIRSSAKLPKNGVQDVYHLAAEDELEYSEFKLKFNFLDLVRQRQCFYDEMYVCSNAVESTKELRW